MTYLLGLRLEGRDVLVVGGGRVARRRIPVLLDAGARVILVAPRAEASLEALAGDGQITWHRRAYSDGDVSGLGDIRLVHAATDDPAANAAIADAAEAHRIWCVRADDRHASSAWTPASGAAAGASVGVIADGDPRRAAGLRDAVVEALGDGSLDARRSRVRLRGVALVGGGPGDPGLITVRGRQLLAQADVVVADRLAPDSLLDRLSPDVEVIDAAKIPYGRFLPQEEINQLLVDRAGEGKFVVRLKGGDPFVFGRGGEEAEACAAAGIPVTVVPGVTSALAGPAAAGIPATHRGVAQEVHVVSAHVPPDDPRSTVDWDAIGRSRATVVVLMGVRQVAAVAAALVRAGRPADTPVAAVQDATLPSQTAVRSTLADAGRDFTAAGVRPPAVFVVGEVVEVARGLDILHGGSGEQGEPRQRSESGAAAGGPDREQQHLRGR
ncbi:uroporphyrinogen-III C-methyltransferase [Nocardiopsis coralliicola]